MRRRLATVLLAPALVACTSSATGTPDQVTNARTLGSGVASSSARPPSSAPDIGAQAAMALVSLAGGDDAPALLWGDRVDYYIGDTQVGEAMSRDRFPAGLESCPPGATEYEQRACPVSPLKTVADLVRAGHTPTVEVGTPAVVGCSTVTRPSTTVGLRAVTIRPPDAPGQRNCFADFAVTLFIDGSEVDAVQFTLGGG